jgi:hypothetical protein
LAAVAIACLCQIDIASAQDVQPAIQLEAAKATEPAQQTEVAFQSGGFAAALSGNNGRTVTGMVELPLLTPHTGSIWATEIGRITPDFDTQISSRYVLGVENSEGLGLRMRYWLFDHDSGAANPDDGVFITQGLKAQTLDFETTQSTEFRLWQMSWFGGMRYANQKYDLGLSDGVDSGSLDVKFEGVGPTLGLNTLRPVGTGRWSMYGGLRGSLIFGDTRLGGTGELADINDVGVRVDEHVMQIWEINMGVQYGHGPLFARFGYEAQVWDSGLPIVNFDVGYAGPTIALGFIR